MVPNDFGKKWHTAIVQIFESATSCRIKKSKIVKRVKRYISTTFTYHYRLHQHLQDKRQTELDVDSVCKVAVCLVFFSWQDLLQLYFAQAMCSDTAPYPEEGI